MMIRPEQHAPQAWQSLFPLTNADIEPLQHRLSQVTAEDLYSFVDVSKTVNSAADIRTALYGAHLTEWHQTQGRVVDAGAAIEQDGGQLYGTILAETHFYRQTQHKLRADDPGAYLSALGAVHRSYDNPYVWAAKTPYGQEVAREVVHTGGKLLAGLCVTLDTHVCAQMRELYRTKGLGDGNIDDMERVSFYRGLVDGVVFFNTYARWRENGAPPETFTAHAAALQA